MNVEKPNMPANEDFLAKNIIIFTNVGLILRLLLYGFPRGDLIWLFIGLSLFVGFGGGGLAWGNQSKNQRITLYGIIAVVFGLLPIHYLF